MRKKDIFVKEWIVELKITGKMDVIVVAPTEESARRVAKEGCWDYGPFKDITDWCVLKVTASE